MNKNVHRVLLLHLFENAKVTTIAAVTASSIILLQFKSVFPVEKLLVWWIALVFINITRLVLALRFLKTPDLQPQHFRRWHLVFVSGLLVSSLIWTYGAVSFFPQSSVFHQSVYLMVFLGVTAGGTFSLSSNLLSVLLHSPVISIGVAFSLFKYWHQEHLIAAVLCLFYIGIYNVILLVTASRHRVVLIKQTSLQMANERLIKRLRMDREQAVSENKAKSTFLATMSHEIRTPLNGLFGMIQILREELKEPSQKADIETMYRSAKSLLGILNDILDFSKISAGKMELESVSFDWVELLNEVAELMKGNAEAKGLAFHLDLTPHEITRVKGDMLRLRQVITNLLDNSIKFTKSGNISLSAWGEMGQNRSFTLYIEVKDTGIGISEEAQKNMFNRFSQADSSTTRQYGGTGLGLAISQKLVEMMNGSISCLSRLNEGSIFSLNVVFEMDPSASLDSESVFSKGAPKGLPPDALSHLRIAVVDDDVVGRKVSKQLLKRLGYSCETFESGVDAIGEFLNQRWDLMFLDMQMPVIDGVETARTLRRMEKSAGVSSQRLHIVACTANLSKEDRERCLEAGMDDYIGKPVLLDELRDVMQRFEGSLGSVWK